tara:strand:- start:44 stop:454 length:411 start_codon:yes stop_codon:yes gene_type:complete
MQLTRKTFAITLTFFSILMAAQANAGELENLSGNWAGTWNSEISGHQGPLKAKFTVAGEDVVKARFTGRFFKVVPFKFNVTLNVTSQKDGVTKLSGKEDLGRALGTYHYDVTYKANEFVAKYHTDKDKGVFQVRKK